MSSTEATTELSKYNTEAHSSLLFAKGTSKSADVRAMQDMIDNNKIQGKKVIEIKLEENVGENEAESQNLTNTVPNNKSPENQDDIVFLITDITDSTLDTQTNDLVTMSTDDFDNVRIGHFSTGKTDDSVTEETHDFNIERKKYNGSLNLQMNRKIPSHQFAGIDSLRRFVTSIPSPGSSLRTRARTDDTDATSANFQAASSTEVQTQTIASYLAFSARFQKKVRDSEEASASTTIQTSVPSADQTQASALDRQTSDETCISKPKTSNQVSGNNSNWVPAGSKDQILGNGTDQTPASVEEQTAINAAHLTPTSAANQIAATTLGKTAENVVSKSPASSINMTKTSPHRIQKPSSSGDKIQTSSSSSSSAGDFVQQTAGTMDETELVGADYQAASNSDDPLAGSTGTLRPEVKGNVTPSMHRKSSRSWFEESKFKSRTNSLKVSNDIGSLNSLGKDMMNKHGMPISNKSGIVSGTENQSTVNVEKPTASVGNLSTVTVGNQSTAIVGNQSSTHVEHQSAANVGQQGRTDDKIQGNTSMGHQTKAKAGNQSTKGFGNQSTKGFGNQSMKGLGNQSTKSFGNQSTKGFGNQSTKGLGNQSMKGFGNQSTTVWGNQSTANAGNQSSFNVTKQDMANNRTQDTANLGNKTKANVGNQGTINKSMPNAGKQSTVNVQTDNMTQGNATSVMKDTGNESRKNFSADPQE
jgi:hypothetical protein